MKPLPYQHQFAKNHQDWARDYSIFARLAFHYDDHENAKRYQYLSSECYKIARQFLKIK